MTKERFMKEVNGEKVFSLEYDKETLKDMVLQLQEENKKLKYYLTSSDNEKQAYINNLERINDEQYETIKKCKAYINECVRLQTIIDKAIEYIKTPIVYETNKIEDLEKSNATRNQDLLNILKGEDK